MDPSRGQRERGDDAEPSPSARAAVDRATEARIDTFLARYTPAIERRLRESRASLRATFPHGFELVFDNYNALVFGFGPGAKQSEAFLSIAGYPRWVTLFFLNGATLPDPAGLLEGSGKQVRGIRLTDADTLASPDVIALIAAACRPHAVALAAAPPLTTTIRTVVAKQRKRRP